MPQLDLSQPPSCHVQVASPQHADANTSSLHQHEPRCVDHRPSFLFHTRGRDKEQGLLEFFCLIGLFSNSHQAPQPTRHQHHHARDKHQHEHPYQPQYMGLPEQYQPVRRSATLPRGGRCQVGILLANQAAQYLKGRTPSNSAGAEFGGYLKRINSSWRKKSPWASKFAHAPTSPNRYASTCNDWPQSCKAQTYQYHQAKCRV